MKVCTNCGIEKPLTEYYKLSHRSSYHARCKPCYRSKIKVDPVKARAASRRYYLKNRDKVIARVKSSKAGKPRPNRIRDQNKVNAHRVVEKAIKNNLLKRQPCVICGKETTHGHHDNYDRPLDVVWLCPKHHGERHRSLSYLDIQ